ncbi:ribbon-helix-helix protein, CopG family [Maridesulfovibrio sp.]|uniref:ribbon-helix-helix protein, CopG family n=1 Tax=Maridesulfovibrio sp. TaxID=2795000 RepID=UPI0029F54449|nr:ribbon-helix-helix protein, CopG family [Maridesulfovibrio sp.]
MQETIRARVEADLKERFELAAKDQGQSSSYLLREFMSDFVRKHEENKKRDAETLLAIESIEAGRFVEGDDVFDWLNSWGTDNVKDAPTCE